MRALDPSSPTPTPLACKWTCSNSSPRNSPPKTPPSGSRRIGKKTEKILRAYPALAEIDRTDFLTSVALYVTAKKGHASAFRESIIELTLDEYRPAADTMRLAFHEAANFMAHRCIITTSQVPYSAQLVPLPS